MSRKRRYVSEEEAAKGLLECQEKGRPEAKYYRCRACSGYHLTSSLDNTHSQSYQIGCTNGAFDALDVLLPYIAEEQHEEAKAALQHMLQIPDPVVLGGGE